VGRQAEDCVVRLPCPLQIIVNKTQRKRYISSLKGVTLSEEEWATELYGKKEIMYKYLVTVKTGPDQTSTVPIMADSDIQAKNIAEAQYGPGNVVGFTLTNSTLPQN
jgi:hypothetical protein